MAITNAMCTSFKAEILGGTHDLDTDVIKIALYTSAASLDATTTAYSATNEVANGNGYTTGGATLGSPAISNASTSGICDFADPVWAAATITARGALIYNSSKSNKAIAVLDFGADKTSTSGDFTVVMPAAGATTAIVRVE